MKNVGVCTLCFPVITRANSWGQHFTVVLFVQFFQSNLKIRSMQFNTKTDGYFVYSWERGLLAA